MEYFECALCFQQFVDPRVLPCGHTFCKRCLEPLKPNNNKLSCLLCSTLFDSVKDLPSNFVVCSWMEENIKNTTSSSSSSSNKILCHNCETKPASLWCEQCAFLCPDCSSVIHSNKALSKHKPITLQEKLKRPSFSQCQKHFKDKEFYCVDDEVLLCHVCVIDDHKPHDVISVFKHVEKVKEELKQLILPLKNTSTSVEQLKQGECLEKIQNERELIKLKEQVKQVENKIINNEENIRQIRERQEKAKTGQLVLLKTIEELNVSDLTDKEKVNDIKSKVQHTIQQVISETTLLSLFKVKKELKGFPYRDCALGGLVFVMTALKPIRVTSLCVMTREAGIWNICVKRINGNNTLNMKSWPDVVAKSAFSFSSKVGTEVWKGSLDMKQNESVSWAISNFGNRYGGQLVSNSNRGKQVNDENLLLSIVSLLDSGEEWKYQNTRDMNMGFIGSIGYLCD